MRKQLVYLLATPFWVATTVLFVGTAAAQPTVSFDLSGTPSVASADTDTLVLQYSVAGSDLENVVVTLDLAPGALPISAAFSGDFTGGCTEPVVPLTHWTCQFDAASLQVPGGGLSGQISVTVRYGKWSFANGQTVAHSASLNADYTDPAGNGSVGPFNNTHSATVSSVQTIGGNTSWTGQSVYVSDPGGQPGIVSEVSFFGTNLGTAPLNVGATLDFVLPAGVGFLEVVGPPLYYAVVSAPAQWQAGTVGLSLIKPFGETFASTCGDFACDYVPTHAATQLKMRVFIPCTALGQVTGTVDTDLVGTVPGHTTGPTSLLSASNQFFGSTTCDVPMIANISNAGGGTVGIGEDFQISIQFDPPGGAVPVYDAFAVIPIPAGVSTLALRADFGTLAAVTSPNGVTIYSCVAPSASAVFTHADFQSTWATSCVAVGQPNLSQTPLPANTTHVVIEAPTWSGTGAFGPVVAGPLSLSLVAHEATCSGVNPTLDFEIYASARKTQGGTLETATATTQVPVLLHSQPFFGSGLPLANIAKGGTGQIVIKPRQSDAPLKNPIITLDIPAGISVMDVRSWSQATCAAPDDFTWSGATSGPATITIDVRGTGPDYYFSEGCNGSTCPGVGHADFQVDLLVHPDHPFLNGEVVTLTETLSGDNTTAPGSPTPVIATTQVSFSVEIPGEKRARIEPACDVGGQEGFTVHYENVGGVSLTNVVVEIPIPKLADGSGTQVDTTWVSTTSAVGTVECNDGSGWSSTCNGTALQTRVLVGNMAPLTSGSVTVLLDTAGAASGTLVRATTTLTSTELLPLPLQPGSPLVVGECPGTVVIDGWHDISNDGVRQANELGIDLWRVALTNQASSITTTVFLGPSGMSTVQLAPETWTVTVVAAPGANPGSAFTTIVPASITVVTGQTQNLDIGVGCQCDDGDACTTDYCSPLGQCLLNLPVQGCCGNLIVNANETCDDGNTDPLDGCNFCQCGQGTLYNATTGHCDPTCGDGLVLPSEECDDANSVSGDGCSADCLEELGYACDLPAQACPPAWFCSGSTPAWCTPDILWCNVFPTYYCTVATNLDCSTVPADASLCTDTTCISQVELCHLCDVMGPSDCTQSLVESCDGIDNDQNGVTDETDFGLGGNPDLIGDPCTPTTGGCGELACDGSGGWECTTLTSPGDSTCDGVDDDCDGLTDEDAAPLSVTCPPSPAAVECAGALTSVSLPTISAQSGCNPVTQSDNAPSGYPLGSTTVTTTLTDAALAVDTCAATVEIVDSVSPVMTCPPDVNVNADPMYCGAFVPLTPTATDVCSAVVVTDDAPLIYDEGATDVTFVAADASGLTDTCSTTVTVTAAPPTITCPPTLTVDAPAEQCYADVTVPATMQPSCGPTIPWNVTSQPCAVGSSDVTLSSPGALPCTTVVTVNDVTGPVINCAMLASVSQIPSTITVGVQDACFVDTISIEAVTCYDKLPGLDLAADCTIVAVSNTLTVTGLFSPASHVSFTVRATDVSGNETVQLCETTVSAMPQGIEICTDGIDNNNDGLVDCADPLCPIDPMCPSLDLDNDGLDYATEQALGTNPNDDDSDDDGLKDGEEDANHNGVQDATETDANVADTDADGLSDGIETTSCYDVDKPNVACAETDPLVLDSDADGLSDGDEDANSNGVVDGSETNPTAADSDFDGANDKAEIDCGTDPNDASDTPVDAAAGLCSPIINTPDPGPAADAGSSADAGGTADTGGTTQTADPGPASSDSASSGCTQSSRRSVPLPMVILMVMLFTAIRVTRRLY